MGLGFGAGGETVAVGDGNRDDDALHFNLAITVPQMPLSEIDGVVNLIATRRAKERHLIFAACWRHCSAQCEIFAKKSNCRVGRSPRPFRAHQHCKLES